MMMSYTSEWFKAAMFYDGDFGYGTHYNAISTLGAGPTPGLHGETYGIHAYSYVNAWIDLSIPNIYEWEGYIEFDPFYVALEHTFFWTRVDQG